MRLKAGAIDGRAYPSSRRAVGRGRDLLADREAREAAYDDVLSRRRGQLVAQLLDRLALELGIVHLLLEQHDRLEPCVELARDDPLTHVLGLVGRLLLIDPHLGLALLGRNVLPTHVPDGGRGGDLHGDIARETHEFIVLGDEVGIAVHLEQHPDLGPGMHVRLHDALSRRSLTEILDLLPLLHAQDLDRLLDVTLRLGERLLAVHHAGARPLTQSLHVLRADLNGAHESPTSAAASLAASSTSPAALSDSPGDSVSADSASADSACGGASGSAGVSAAAGSVSAAAGAVSGAAGALGASAETSGGSAETSGALEASGASDGAGASAGPRAPPAVGSSLLAGVGAAALSASANFSPAAASAAAFAAASAAAFSAASAAAFSAAACSSASRRARASASRRAFSSASWRARSSSARNTAWPSATTSPIARVIRAQERIASSLPGITKSMPSGSQFVSTSPMMGIRRRWASRTAMTSVLRSITNIAFGTRCMFLTPPRLALSFARSAWADMRSRVGSSAS